MANFDSTEKLYLRHSGARAGAFSDPHIILVAPGDKRLPSLPQGPLSIQQEDRGPVLVCISALASDGALEQVHARYNVPLEELQHFRAQQAAKEVVCHAQ